MMSMSAAHAEFDRKIMMRRAGGRQQLRIWAKFPSSVERNECYDRLNERDPTTGKCKSYVAYRDNPVEVWRPDIRDQKYMMKKLIAGRASFPVWRRQQQSTVSQH